MDPIQKRDLSNKNALKYSEMDPEKKEERSKRKSIKYKEMDPLVKRKLNENKSVNMKRNMIQSIHLKKQRNRRHTKKLHQLNKIWTISYVSFVIK
jgi:uncharacterized membrane protein YhiD involved in acid resistance